MGEVRIPPPVKLVCGLLAGSRELLSLGKEKLSSRFGSLDLENPEMPFDFTAYYEKELGPGLLRQYVSFENLVPRGELASIKLSTNRMEMEASREGKRAFNLDPGYLDLSKMVLASTKDATYRVYLGEGIYGQPTYFYRDKTYRPYDWTYPDYRSETAISFFNRVREIYKGRLRGNGTG